MSPPPVTVTKEKVLDAALQIVREAGYAALTARAVAARLGCSVAPIYRVCGSMEQLATEVLEKIRQLLAGYTARSYTAMPFRNAGVGMVLFARDEPNLYLALFGERHHFKGVIQEFCAAMAATVAEDPTFAPLGAAARQELLEEMWTYSHGLAMFVVTGMVADVSEAAINRRMGRIGFAVITAAFGGDTGWACGGPDCAGEEMGGGKTT
ncbi:TetR/AcrR family transcriptional regulator [Geomesophilobacter sediminis]|uniref:TetR family transcriptional regulator n=1 Tax=Geomesophilobacter sediminis TaxID=2798584 RepID=A0A8J7JDX8_9BACT|nr:TetR family transcriptional regulator [Geomesophilobacter sediminis]MBJ6725498.1 TetR family transcriptional regulator [Geomesophilobacter sediminis]